MVYTEYSNGLLYVKDVPQDERPRQNSQNFNYSLEKPWVKYQKIKIYINCCIYLLTLQQVNVALRKTIIFLKAFFLVF